MLYKTQGIIIRSSNLNEVDRLITAYTKDFGKILVKAKSVRRNQAKLKGHLELFLHSHLMLAKGKGFDIITSAETIESFPYLHQNLSSLFSSYYLSELIDKLILGPEKDKQIWNLIQNSFSELDNQGKNNKEIVKEFEDKFLEYLGYGKQKDFLKFVQNLAGQEIKSASLLTRAECF